MKFFYYAILSSLIPVFVFASWSSPQGDFWFSEKIEMDQSALPLGVAWHPENETITNSSQTPFIIVLENNAIYPHELPQELQDVGYRVSDPYTGVYIIKFQDSNSYRWATEHASNEPANPRWEKFSNGEPTIKILLSQGDISTANKPANIAQYFQQSTSFKDRPKDVTIPAPQPFSFNGYYGKQPISIKGTINYSLYPNYHSPSEVQEMQNYKDLSLFFLELIVFGLVVWIGVVLLKLRVFLMVSILSFSLLTAMFCLFIFTGKTIGYGNGLLALGASVSAVVLSIKSLVRKESVSQAICAVILAVPALLMFIYLLVIFALYSR